MKEESHGIVESNVTEDSFEMLQMFNPDFMRLESCLLAVLILGAVCFECLMDLAKRCVFSKRSLLEGVESRTYVEKLWQRLQSELMVLGLLAFLVWTIKQLMLFESLSRVVHDVFEIAIAPEEIVEVVEDIHMWLFIGMLLYFFIAALIAKKVIFHTTFNEMACREVKSGFGQFHPMWRRTNEEWRALLESMPNFEHVDRTNIYVSKYLACLFDETMDEIIEFKPCTWFLSASLFIAMSTIAFAIRAPFFTVVIPASTAGWAIVVLNMVRRSYTFATNFILGDKSFPELHQESRKSIHSKHHTETTMFRIFQAFTFLNCYSCAKMATSRDLWENDARLMGIAILVQSVCFILFGALVLPPQIIIYTIAMGSPPNFDPGNQATFAEVFKKYPDGAPLTDTLAADIKSASDLPSEKYLLAENLRTPWKKCEIDFCTPKFVHCIQCLFGHSPSEAAEYQALALGHQRRV